MQGIFEKKLDPAGNVEDSLENLQYFYHPDHLGSAAVISFPLAVPTSTYSTSRLGSCLYLKETHRLIQDINSRLKSWITRRDTAISVQGIMIAI